MDKITIYDVDPQEYNEKLAHALKNVAEFEVPEWASYVKTSTNRQRPPFEQDFWFKRAASILRQLYIHDIKGVQRLRTRYGGRKKRGAKPPEFRKGGGKIIRTILQQGEKAGLVEQNKGAKKGRKLTQQGREFLDQIASDTKLDKSKYVEQKPEQRAEEVKNG